MGKLLVQGASSHAFLDGLSANDLPTTPGRARYTHLLRDDGTIIDDVIVTALANDRFFVVCNAGPRPGVVAWLGMHRPSEVRIDDLTTAHLCLALQGPSAPALLQGFTTGDLSRIKPFWGASIDFAPRRAGFAVEAKGWGSPSPDALLGALDGGPPAMVSGGTRVFITRTGYTGEPGFELFPPTGTGQAVWEALLAAGAAAGIRPIGLGARDTLRLEKGYLLSGQDFTGTQTPLEVNCAWVVKWDHPFVGRPALEAQRAQDAYPRLVALKMLDRGIPRHGFPVMSGGARVGTVTSGTLSPSLRVGIALASVDRAHASDGARVEVDIRGSAHPAQVTRLPFL